MYLFMSLIKFNIYYYRYLTDYYKKKLLNNDVVGVPIIKNFTFLVIESGGYENIFFNERDMRNILGIERRRIRL